MERLERILSTHLFKTAEAEVTIGTVLLGVLVLLVSLAVARWLARGVERLLQRRGHSEGVQYAFSRVTRYVVALIGIGAAFDSMGFNLTAILAASTVLLVGIGFGLQNIAQNFISGIIVLLEQPVRKGDFIRVGESVGTVSNIGLRATEVVTRDEVTIIVPNSELVSAQVINHSKPTRNLRVWLPIGVHYKSDPAVVRRVLAEVMAAAPQVQKDQPMEVRFEGFGDSSLDFALVFWIEDPREDLRIASELRFAVHAALKANDIEIPYPQRDLHLRSGFEPFAAARAEAKS